MHEDNCEFVNSIRQLDSSTRFVNSMRQIDLRSKFVIYAAARSSSLNRMHHPGAARRPRKGAGSLGAESM